MERIGSGLLLPVPEGTKLKLIHGYHDPADDDCPDFGPNRADHCLSQRFGIDLDTLSPADDLDILAPVAGTVSRITTECLYLQIHDSQTQLAICHFATFCVQEGQPVERGQCLGKYLGTNLHLSLANGLSRNSTPIPFTCQYSVQGRDLTPDGSPDQRFPFAFPDEGMVSGNAGSCPDDGCGDEHRIVLTWNENPSDLDSHLWLPEATPYEIYFGDEGQLDVFPFAALSEDITDGFGPEIITIADVQPGTYTYAVKLFGGAGTIGTSGAKVRLYRGGTLLRTFTPPASELWDEEDGDYIWWAVFTLDSNGGVTTINAPSVDPYPYLGTLALRSNDNMPKKTDPAEKKKSGGHHRAKRQRNRHSK